MQHLMTEWVFKIPKICNFMQPSSSFWIRFTRSEPVNGASDKFQHWDHCPRIWR